MLVLNISVTAVFCLSRCLNIRAGSAALPWQQNHDNLLCQMMWDFPIVKAALTNSDVSIQREDDGGLHANMWDTD